MRVFSIFWIILLCSIAMAMSGCCDDCGCDGCCGDCCGDEDDDYSEDDDDDGSYAQEQDMNRQPYVQQQQAGTQGSGTVGNTGTPAPTPGSGSSGCTGENRVDATCIRSGSDSGYTYTYTITIDACDSTVGFVGALTNPTEVIVEQGEVAQGREGYSRSGDFQSTTQFNQFCVRSNAGEKCIPLG